MNKIEFKVGYYEWNVYLNGENIYAFTDSNDEITDDVWSINHIPPEEEDYRYNSLEELVETYIDHMQDELKDDGREFLDDKGVLELKKQMIKAWSRHFGIKE